MHKRGGGCSGQGLGCGSEPSALTVELDCDVVCGRPMEPVPEGRGGLAGGGVCKGQAPACHNLAMVPVLRG